MIISPTSIDVLQNRILMCLFSVLADLRIIQSGVSMYDLPFNLPYQFSLLFTVVLSFSFIKVADSRAYYIHSC